MKLFDLLLFILFGLLLVLFSPILLLLAAYAYVASAVGEWRFRRYIAANEGVTFFAYTNKASSENYVKENILPLLPRDTRIFYLAGKKGRVNMGEDLGLLAHVVSAMRETPGGFPYVSKIENGELVTESINNRLYSAIRRGVEADQIIERIRKFYSK